MQRREFTAVAILFATAGAGCIQDESQSLGLTPIDDIVEYVTVEDSPEAFEEALKDGYVSYDEPVLETGEYAQYRGMYYRGITEQAGTTAMERQVLIGRPEDAQGAVEIDAYGDGDRRMVTKACQSGLESDSNTGHAVLPSDPEETELLPEPTYPRVRMGDAVCGLSLDTREVEVKRHRTKFEKVADDREQFLKYIDEKYVVEFDSDGLTDSEREVLETAVEEKEYSETGESEAFDSIASRLDITAERRILRYDGHYYRWEYP